MEKPEELRVGRAGTAAASSCTRTTESNEPETQRDERRIYTMGCNRKSRNRRKQTTGSVGTAKVPVVSGRLHNFGCNLKYRTSRCSPGLSSDASRRFRLPTVLRGSNGSRSASRPCMQEHRMPAAAASRKQRFVKYGCRRGIGPVTTEDRCCKRGRQHSLYYIK